MDEEITIIDANTRNEKIRIFFVKNKKILIIIISTIIFLSIGYLSFDQISKRNKAKLVNQFNSIIIDYNNATEKGKIINDLSVLIKKKDKTYSPLALYFLIDNNLINNKDEVNNLFNILIDKTNLELEIKNLLIYKKAIFKSNFVNEFELLSDLKPLLNNDSLWNPHALLLMGDYLVSKNQKIKAKEFYLEVLSIKNLEKNLYNHASSQLTLITND